MTFLAVSIPPSYAKIVVSADMGLAPTKARDTLPTGDAWCPAEMGAAPVQPARLVGKILRTGDLVVAALGAYGALAGMVELIRNHPVTELDDALDLGLRGHLAAFNVPPSIVFLAGRSKRLDRLAAYMWSAPGYAPVEVPPGHTLHPPPCGDLPDYDRLCDLWTPAAYGERVEAFHELVAANVRQAWRERRLREPAAFGGDLQTLTLTEAGMVEREAAGFWSGTGLQ